jgi:hypothetical protein
VNSIEDAASADGENKERRRVEIRLGVVNVFDQL